MITQQQIDDARDEMIFREDQLHAVIRASDNFWQPLNAIYDKAREAYLTLLMEYRLSQLQTCEHEGGTLRCVSDCPEHAAFDGDWPCEQHHSPEDHNGSGPCRCPVYA